MITHSTLGGMLKRTYGALRAKAKASSRPGTDVDRHEFKNRKAYEKHERNEPKDERRVETQIVGPPKFLK